MALKIDKDIADKVKACNFNKKCLKNFDSSLCCDVTEKCAHFLMVIPVSTFKSTNCSYRQLLKKDGADIHVCSCPVRYEWYEKYGK